MDSGVRAGQLRIVAQGHLHRADRFYLVLREHHTSGLPRDCRWLHFWEVLMDGQVAVWGEQTISSDRLVSETEGTP